MPFINQFGRTVSNNPTFSSSNKAYFDNINTISLLLKICCNTLGFCSILTSCDTLTAAIFNQGVWKMWVERFECDNHLGLTKAFTELNHMTSLIKYLLLIKMFIFINATKVTTKKISFYTNWQAQDAGVQSEKGSKGGEEGGGRPLPSKKLCPNF